MTRNYRAIDSPEFQEALRRAEGLVLQDMAKERELRRERYHAEYTPQAMVFDVESESDEHCTLVLTSLFQLR